MSTEVEKILDSRMDIDESLRLHARFETAHIPRLNSSRLM